MARKSDYATARRSLLAAVLFLGAATCSATAQNVAVFVSGEPITALDVDQRGKLEQVAGRKNLTRQQVLDLLIDDKLKVREGKKWGLEISDSDVDQSYATMAGRMRQNADTLTQNLA